MKISRCIQFSKKKSNTTKNVSKLLLNRIQEVLSAHWTNPAQLFCSRYRGHPCIDPRAKSSRNNTKVQKNNIIHWHHIHDKNLNNNDDDNIITAKNGRNFSFSSQTSSRPEIQMDSSRDIRRGKEKHTITTKI